MESTKYIYNLKCWAYTEGFEQLKKNQAVHLIPHTILILIRFESEMTRSKGGIQGHDKISISINM